VHYGADDGGNADGKMVRRTLLWFVEMA